MLFFLLSFAHLTTPKESAWELDRLPSAPLAQTKEAEFSGSSILVHSAATAAGKLSRPFAGEGVSVFPAGSRGSL